MTLVTDLERLTSSIIVWDRWLLLFGGATPAGVRRANRICRSALDSDLAVIWYSGVSEPVADSAFSLADDPRVILVDYSVPRQGKWWQLASERNILAQVSIRRIWKTLERRIRTVLRPYATWRALRPSLMRIASAEPPVAIAFCDDTVIPSAWHMARVWPACPVVNGVPESWK